MVFAYWNLCLHPAYCTSYLNLCQHSRWLYIIQTLAQVCCLEVLCPNRVIMAQKYDQIPFPLQLLFFCSQYFRKFWWRFYFSWPPLALILCFYCNSYSLLCYFPPLSFLKDDNSDNMKVTELKHKVFSLKKHQFSSNPKVITLWV